MAIIITTTAVANIPTINTTVRDQDLGKQCCEGLENGAEKKVKYNHYSESTTLEADRIDLIHFGSLCELFF